MDGESSGQDPAGVEPEQTRTVVVIDDHDDTRDLIVAALRHEGYRVSATGVPRDAVALVLLQEPDLVLCDIAMPEMDGYAVVRALQSDPGTRRFPVVFLTGRSEFTERVRAFRFGVVDFITKPVTPGTLAGRVDQILDSLGHRTGVLEAGEGDAPILLQDLKRDGRSGILTVGSDPSAPRVIVRAGEVVGELAAPTSNGGVRFEEIDAVHEDIVVRDPPRLPAPSSAPQFNDVPEALRDVLVADDNDHFRSFLAESFVALGFRVREAADGEDALRQVLERPPALLIVDVCMPLLDGFEVCRRMRSHALTRHVPIVFLSGFDGFEDRAAGLAAGADEFLSKQTSLRELVLRVRLLLNRYSRPTEGDALMEGRLDLMGAPAVLQFCHYSALTGTLTSTDGARTLHMGFHQGALTSADSQATHGVDAVFEFLGWERGTFRFVGGSPYGGTAIDMPVPALMLEGCLRLDVPKPDGSPSDFRAGAS